MAGRSEFRDRVAQGLNSGEGASGDGRNVERSSAPNGGFAEENSTPNKGDSRGGIKDVTSINTQNVRKERSTGYRSPEKT